MGNEKNKKDEAPEVRLEITQTIEEVVKEYADNTTELQAAIDSQKLHYDEFVKYDNLVKKLKREVKKSSDKIIEHSRK
jgi:hypothetical protein